MKNDAIEKENNTQNFSTWEPSTLMCPNCGSNDTLIDVSCVLTSYPAQYPYKCRKCGKHWSSTEHNRNYDFIGSTPPWRTLEIEAPSYQGQTGWICPKCGGVFAPHMNYCMNCTQPKAPLITYVDLGGGNITGTGMGTVSVTNKYNTAITRNHIDGTSIATFGSMSEDSNGNKSNI